MRANAVREEAVSLTNELGPALHAIHAIGVDRLPSWTHVAPCRVLCAPEPESGQPFANCKKPARKDRLDTLIGEANKLIVEGSFLINIR